MDDVLNEFTDHFVRLHYERTGETLVFDIWDLHEKSEHGLAIWDTMKVKDFFYDAPVQEGVHLLFKFLEVNSSVFDFKIVSSYYGDCDKAYEDTKRQKIAWLSKHFKNNDLIERFHLVRGSKQEHPADIILDDHVNNMTGDKLKILYQRKHNTWFKSTNDDPTILTNIDTLPKVVSLLRDVVVEGSVERYMENKLGIDI